MSKKTEPIIINVYRDCGTCASFECFNEENDNARCKIDNKIINNIEEDCDKWKFNLLILNEISDYTDLKNSTINFQDVEQ